MLRRGRKGETLKKKRKVERKKLRGEREEKTYGEEKEMGIIINNVIG